ncbi:MAG TPA: alpha/beta hydrolase [Xanthobacteraceae bacterium]|jgi:pimeloyl-ACP methyl ester carboxylesterase|nr:alpha/beta hydrolase [Xanthobacteraceae bacterium]
MVENKAAAGTDAPDNPTRVICGVRIEMIERGGGTPLLFLHPEIGIAADAKVLDRLAERARLLAPSHPGFGNSEQPPTFNTIDDLAYFYLDFLDELDLRDVILVGVSLGGWIAAEIAVKSCARLSHLVLASPVGIKVSGRETRDIADIFALTEEQLAELAYFDPGTAKPDYKSMPDSDVRKVARNREATARYGWSPYLHDPKLRQRLHRISVPTLLLCGAADRILAQGYAEAYAAAIPGSGLETIPRAGHFPHLEQPEQFAERVFALADGRTA